MNFPENLYYTEEHIWIEIKENNAFIGITDFAQSQLADIVFVEKPNINTEIKNNEIFGTIEAVKTVSDLFAPLDILILEFNDLLNSSPEIIHQNPYENWIIKVKILDENQIKKLLNAENYKKIIE